MSTNAIIGTIMMLIIIGLLFRKLMPMIPAFTVIPVITMFIMGYKPAEFEEILGPNIKGAMTGTALLLMFSITFFSLISETGVFDRIIDRVIKMARGNVFIVLFATVVVATIAQIDGSMITTYVITIPALLGLYDKMKLDRRILLLLTALVTVGFNPPWGSTMNQNALIAGIDAFTMFNGVYPAMIIIYCLIVVTCIYFGIQHRKVFGKIVTDENEIQSNAKQDSPFLRPRLFWVNCALIIGLLICLNFSGLPTYICFMLFLGLVLIIDYPNPDDQGKLIRKTAPTFLNPVMLIVAIAVLVGMLNNTGIMKELSQAILSIIPMGMLKYTHIIFALLIVPVCQFVPYQVYMALYPFLIGIGEACGIPSIMIMAPFAVNLIFGTCCSRYVAQTHLGIGLITEGKNESADAAMDAFVKWAFPKCLILNVTTILICVMLGIF